MIAECLLIRDENHLLLEHLAYNAAAGIDHFFIYDNLSDTPVVDFLRENARDFLNICTVARYQSADLQIDCYADYLKEHRHVDWTLFCDTDEILMGNIRDAVAEFGGDYNCLSFSPILHGCNGHLQRPRGGTMQELYGADILSRAHHWYKVCAKTADITSQYIHNNAMINKRLIYLTADKYPSCVLHHYRFRSFEDYLLKFQRGRANIEKKGCWVPHISDFFALHKNIKPDDPEVVSLMQKYGVNLGTAQKHFDVYPSN